MWGQTVYDPQKMTNLTTSSKEQKPNSPIVLEDILITHISGHRLEKPFSARVVLRLSPTLVTVIESESLPAGILDHRMEMPFVVTTSDNRDVQVVRSSLRTPGLLDGTARGSLALYKSPFTVTRRDTKIKSISFSVINFPKFFGRDDSWIDSVRVGATTLAHKNLQVSLTQVVSLCDHEKLLKETDGYGVTHTGVIEYRDGVALSVEEAEGVLRGLRAFLSFARGAGCGLTLVKATRSDGGQTFFEWGSAHTDPWSRGDDTWLPTIVDGGENLSQAFFGFWSLCNDPNWKDVLFRTIDLYVNSKTAPFHVGIILIQAALESLCYKIIGAKKEDSTGQFLSKSIQKIGLCTSIPSSCKHLDMFFRNCSRVGDDGPKAITEIRNDLVHAKQTYQVNAEVQMDALRLGHWYIETILLKQFGYHGRYRNRLAITGESPFELVPWARSGHSTGMASEAVIPPSARR